MARRNRLPGTLSQLGGRGGVGGGPPISHTVTSCYNRVISSEGMLSTDYEQQGLDATSSQRKARPCVQTWKALIS